MDSVECLMTSRVLLLMLIIVIIQRNLNANISNDICTIHYV